MARALLEGDNPSARKRGLSKPPAFPSTAWGCRPKTLRFFLHSAFFGFARLRIAFPAHFWASRACARLTSACFFASRACARLPRRGFWLRALAHCFPGVFLGFARLLEAFPMCFFASRACARFSLRVFWLCAFAHCFPCVFSGFARLRTAFLGVFSGFARVFEAFSVCFLASRVCARFSQRGLRAFWAENRGFGARKLPN